MISDNARGESDPQWEERGARHGEWGRICTRGRKGRAERERRGGGGAMAGERRRDRFWKGHIEDGGHGCRDGGPLCGVSFFVVCC